ncbi:MAG TPA: Xaa-Pro peptidase family protein [Gaiellaceae bacterium]
MTALLVFADSIRSPEMRHEVPLPVPDPFLYLERDGKRTVVASAFELQRIGEAAPDIEALAPEAYGLDDLLRDGMSRDEAELECYVRLLQERGVSDVSVPPTFPLELADHLRTNGIDVRADRALFADRRRRKNAQEIEGLRRAQRACEAALDVARDMLRRARPNGVLTLDGEPLTSERLKLEIERVFSEHGAVGDEFIVAHGPQTAIGHELGSGALKPGEPIVFDLFPRDRATGIYSDMTRTYVVGEVSDELREYHRLCKEALDRTTAATKPGANGRDLMQMACDLFHEHGHMTQLHKEPGEVLDSGFFHGLGHGVGLEVHEPPALSRSGDDLVAGDVITLEPGLYRAGYGGVRLEDILLVTDDGAEVITQYPYDLEA